MIVYCNGSGVTGSRIDALFRHWASWGFIVLANEDSSTWSGASADQTLSFLLSENEREGSMFFGRVDTLNIGITGHSQGGVGVFNAVTVQSHAGLYKTAVPVSPTHEELAVALNWPYDPAMTDIPVLLLAGDGQADSETVIPLDKMIAIYDKLPSPKAMARKAGIDHDVTDSDMDGYVTAWFLWQLQGNTEAEEAFTGTDAELLQNSLYIDQRINTDNRSESLK